MASAAAGALDRAHADSGCGDNRRRVASTAANTAAAAPAVPEGATVAAWRPGGPPEHALGRPLHSAQRRRQLRQQLGWAAVVVAACGILVGRPLRIDSKLGACFARKHCYPVTRNEFLKYLDKPDLSEQERAAALLTCRGVYADYIRKCARRPQEWFRALVLLEEMRRINVHDTSETYLAAMDACAAKGYKGWANVLAILDEVRSNNEVAETADHFNRAIHTMMNQWIMALNIYQEMRDDGIAPNEKTYKVMCKLSCRSRNWRLGLTLLDELENSDFGLTKSHFMKVLQACEDCYEDEWVDVLEERAAELGFELIVDRG